MVAALNLRNMEHLIQPFFSCKRLLFQYQQWIFCVFLFLNEVLFSYPGASYLILSAFIHLFNKYLLSTYDVTSSVLRLRVYRGTKQTKSLPSSQGGKRIMKK